MRRPPDSPDYLGLRTTRHALLDYIVPCGYRAKAARVDFGTSWVAYGYGVPPPTLLYQERLRVSDADSKRFVEANAGPYFDSGSRPAKHAHLDLRGPRSRTGPRRVRCLSMR